MSGVRAPGPSGGMPRVRVGAIFEFLRAPGQSRGAPHPGLDRREFGPAAGSRISATEPKSYSALAPAPPRSGLLSESFNT